ncbi:hypothetical protein METBIDRAFT_107537 [Metschnikowia bicuspidata var. bicuspidata NRRL YB-4993]|uniref:Uncharacterized protein n=1 Tax=Metschnikowia bicuspidata var. bicuspidata NRRL YB-4993 TaxID=869754 RepID=A0A1A0HH91_9ASCO|nr:hypothetical protein METBIDRAFT_107537 [Metschnikowia bicuspidata var. bicuspidata NRRL YB-4993]OBA23549.1 hypothetical protein METBIDRAFT_107537 [Metschnikowia bicuspidata var. bicuspidata NRRL YB-4993]
MAVSCRHSVFYSLERVKIIIRLSFVLGFSYGCPSKRLAVLREMRRGLFPVRGSNRMSYACIPSCGVAKGATPDLWCPFRLVGWASPRAT